jgi:hypothetical protein
MKAEMKKTDAGTPVRNNKQHKGSYPKAAILSSFTIQIGELLILLAGNKQPEGWRQFEQLLRQFYNGGVL